MWFRLSALILSAFLVLQEARAQGREIRVAAAADLKFAMEELSQQFEKQTGTRVNVTYGSSGNFFSQIQNGAPFDLFFSADIEYPRKLAAAGLAEPGTLYEYAIGRIVIWMPADAKVDVARQGWKSLLDASIEKIAIANPGHAPYGRAAVAALQRADIYKQVKNQTGLRRKHFAGSAVRAVGKCASGNCGSIAGDFPRDARWETMGDSSGNASRDRTGSNCFERRKK